jgi:hypothetical protein
MSTPRRTPLLVLLLVVFGLLTPAAGAATAHASTSAMRLGHVRTTADAPAPDRAEHRSQRPMVAAAPAAPSAPLHSTPARDARPNAPQLLLVQRPRPPTSAPPASAPSAPTGRSPPSPAGT